MKSLKDLYKNHSGKVSDKWTIYLDQYDEKLKKYQHLPVKLLEIGVLNGGSLEIFSKYFSNAKLILGCDIDPKCKNLKYNKDENIILINGDVNDNKTKEKILEHSKFDIILDDGSHNSDDVVKTFCNYFNHLKDGGLYIIEDLHCSYWREHKGGIFFPISSMNFLKKLVDIVNHEHWGIKKNKEWLLKGFLENYKINIERLDLESINSIEFINSLCFIKKEASTYNKLGKRVVVGQEAIVVPDRKKLNNIISQGLNQEVNPWSNSELLPEQELVLSQKKLKKFEEKINSLEKEIQSLKNK